MNTVMQRFKKALFIIIGTIFIFLGSIGAIFFVIAQGDRQGMLTGIGGCLLGVAFGVWLIRRVERNIWKALVWGLDHLIW